MMKRFIPLKLLWKKIKATIEKIKMVKILALRQLINYH
uniref:Uncharacterized protein n=1 Tax=Rhizophora mucronata TaxID=61149 RepID=A0A2P2K5E0_RHIMU